jgi:hypothetical protein
MSLPSARPIAFNRHLRASWLREGLRLIADGTDSKNWIERMTDLLKESISGKESITKSMRYLRHIWIESGSSDLLRADAIGLYSSRPSENTSVLLSWGMAIAGYPFLNDVASTVGRMLRVQPEVKLEQIIRKLTETYGERETIRRSIRFALVLICDFGFVKHSDNAGCYVIGRTIKADSSAVSGWLVRAWFAATGGSAVIDRVVMAGSPSLAFFDSATLISDAVEVGVLIPERLSFSQDVLRLVETHTGK